MDKIVISFFKYLRPSKFFYGVNIHIDLLIH